VPTWDATTRRVFGNHIKKVAANRLHKCEGKYLNGVDLTVFWRCTISLNEDCILTLPPVDESIEDKLCIFSCTGSSSPSDEDRGGPVGGNGTLTREVPHYAHCSSMTSPSRTAWRIGDLASSLPAPRLVLQLEELSPERKLLEMIDLESSDGRRIPSGCRPSLLEGSSSDLYHK